MGVSNQNPPLVNVHLENPSRTTVIGASYLRSRLLRRARRHYNSGSFRASRRVSKVTNILFRDRESLDILARSNLRLKNYAGAIRSYRQATRRGFSLLDHEINQFSSEIGSEDYVSAYRTLSSIKGKKNRSESLSKLVNRLGSLTDTERLETINQMNEISPLPNEISDLLPWAPRKVERHEEDSGDYSPLSNGSISSQRYQREISRIRSSGAFRISKHISESIRKPTRLLMLPFSIPVLAVKIFRERKGYASIEDSSHYVADAPISSRDCILLFPTNGVGFGHFTRLLAIARKYREASPETEIVFFTTMPTLHILSEEGFVCYHMPGRYRYQDMDAKNWNALCEEMLSLIFTLHRPKAFVFDGSFPYRGMLNSIKSQSRGMIKIWVRRGAIKKGSKNIPVDSIRHFDAIIRPGDSVPDDFRDETRHSIQIVKTNPILLENISGDSKRPDIRSMLGVPKEAILCYIQLGAGQINDIDSELSFTLDALSEHHQAYAVIGESMLGERLRTNHDRVRILRDYPNSMYFDEFDFSVIAGGYNSYHEVINSALPSICFPNLSTGRDDQLSRAQVAAECGAMVVLKKRSKENIRVAISRMMDPKTRKMMRANAIKIRSTNGADEASKWISSQT